MRKTIAAISLAITLLSPIAALADQYVRGYTKSNGTFVSPYVRSTPNGTTLDNYGR